ncbi:hypothetical protein LIER_23819 [Lithospermum erythrorhizon]|uniref:Uncharacterized protein n=1 Tax=Lithospermum erythrorhizon TaxID=34254 RepID=A0AAV3R164_LITER
MLAQVACSALNLRVKNICFSYVHILVHGTSERKMLHGTSVWRLILQRLHLYRPNQGWAMEQQWCMEHLKARKMFEKETDAIMFHNNGV